MALKEKAQVFAIKKALEYMDKDPAVNIPKLVDWMDTFDVKGTLKEEINAVRTVVNDKDSNWYKLIMSLWQDIDPGVRNTLFENFIINASLLGYQKQCENKEKYNCNIPWAILIDPKRICSISVPSNPMRRLQGWTLPVKRCPFPCRKKPVWIWNIYVP